MKHVASFSTGLSSALTVERLLSRHKTADIVFMDTTIEDDDNYRFMRDVQARWGVPITVLCEGRTPYQVFSDQHVIPNHRVAPCTQELKIKMFVNYLKENYAGQDVTIHIGYDYTETHRCSATRKNYEAQGWAVDFPLLWKPYELRPYAQVCREDWGIEPPRMYALGYSHANCGGRCVKQGQADWLRTLINFPERYAEAEAWEKGMRENPTNQNYALLQDRTGGSRRAKTLQEFRESFEADKLPSLLDEIGCIHCGVGDLAAVTPPPDQGAKKG